MVHPAKCLWTPEEYACVQKYEALTILVSYKVFVSNLETVRHSLNAHAELIFTFYSLLFMRSAELMKSAVPNVYRWLINGDEKSIYVHLRY